MNQRFLPQEKLKSKKRITAIFSRGSSQKFYPFVLWYLPGEAGIEYNRLALSVPKRRIATAVKRNLIKRRTREAYRLQKEIFAESENNLNYDMVWVYIAREPLAYDAIAHGVKNGLRHLATIQTLQ